jgi:hypothetical protein
MIGGVFQSIFVALRPKCAQGLINSQRSGHHLCLSRADLVAGH